MQRVWLGGVVLARIDVDDQLHLGFVPPQRQSTTAKKDNFRFILICCFITAPVKNFFVFNRPTAKHQLQNHKKEKKVKKSWLERIESAKNRKNSALTMANHSPLIATASC